MRLVSEEAKKFIEQGMLELNLPCVRGRDGGTLVASNYLAYQTIHGLYCVDVHYVEIEEKRREPFITETTWDEFLKKLTPPLNTSDEWQPLNATNHTLEELRD